MRKLKNIAAAVALGAVALGGTYLSAQPADPAADPVEEPVVDPAPAPAPAPAEPDVSAPVETRANVSPAEMKANSETMITEMKGFLERVIALQQIARKQKDVIKLNCVNDRLLMMKKLLNIGESARNDLVEAIAAQDEDDRYHHYGKIVISKERTGALRDEAEACIGEELIFLGPTQVDIDTPDVPDDPTNADPFDLGLDFERPGYASPFR